MWVSQPLCWDAAAVFAKNKFRPVDLQCDGGDAAAVSCERASDSLVTEFQGCVFRRKTIRNNSGDGVPACAHGTGVSLLPMRSARCGVVEFGNLQFLTTLSVGDTSGARLCWGNRKVLPNQVSKPQEEDTCQGYLNMGPASPESSFRLIPNLLFSRLLVLK